MATRPVVRATQADLPQLAAVALRNVGLKYPFHLAHLVHAEADLRPPHQLHPVFGNSYDWHSSVHMHWTLARCLRLAPQLPEAAAIRAHLAAAFTAHKVAGEVAYFDAAGRATFERPYGWGWLLMLHAELARLAQDDARAAPWRDALAPLAHLLAERLRAFLPRQDHAVRAGTHGNTAFALVLAHAWAVHFGNTTLAALIGERAHGWFAADRAFPAHYEPGGDDFLSGGLCEALLMRRVLPATDWSVWWSAFRPADPARWLQPASVADARDAKTVHLHGLNLSRAWCWHGLLGGLPAREQPMVVEAIEALLGASLLAATVGDYVGTHWLASFALLALTEPAL